LGALDEYCAHGLYLPCTWSFLSGLAFTLSGFSALGLVYVVGPSLHDVAWYLDADLLWSCSGFSAVCFMVPEGSVGTCIFPYLENVYMFLLR